jgi:hypothetical protein
MANEIALKFDTVFPQFHLLDLFLHIYLICLSPQQITTIQNNLSNSFEREFFWDQLNLVPPL